jgi:GDP-D-mannose dehydratase
MYSLGDSTKAAQVLDWRPTVKLPEIVARMIRAEQEGAGTL